MRILMWLVSVSIYLYTNSCFATSVAYGFPQPRLLILLFSSLLLALAVLHLIKRFIYLRLPADQQQSIKDESKIKVCMYFLLVGVLPELVQLYIFDPMKINRIELVSLAFVFIAITYQVLQKINIKYAVLRSFYFVLISLFIQISIFNGYNAFYLWKERAYKNNIDMNFSKSKSGVYWR